jgi:histidinol dehydrogenase
MIQLIDLRNRTIAPHEFADIVPRSLSDVSSVTAVAAELIADVRSRGEAALREQADRLDGCSPSSIRVKPEEIAAAVEALPPAVRAALEEAIARVTVASSSAAHRDRACAGGFCHSTVAAR